MLVFMVSFCGIYSALVSLRFKLCLRAIYLVVSYRFIALIWAWGKLNFSPGHVVEARSCLLLIYL